MNRAIKNPFERKRKGAVSVLCIVCMLLAGSFYSCGERGEDKLSEPIEIPFTEYSLAGTSCQWKNFDPNKVIIINSHDELKNYMDCTDDNYQEIDFSKHTLLLANGWASSSPADIIKILLQKKSTDRYSLYLEVRQGMLLTPGRWIISIIVPKLSQNATITLNVDTHL